jgi:cellulose synthase (UDP-forming)
MDDRRTEPMTPGLLLMLWRERWGKAGGKNQTTPYLEGLANSWGRRLTHLSLWSLPGVTIVAGLVCLLLFALLLTVQFSTNGQIVFSIFLICLTLFLHRYAGTFVTLVLLGLTVIVSARYLYWRFSATLVPDLGWAFIFGFCLCVAEVHLWLLMIVRSMQVIWPLKQANALLPDESAQWPTVDILVSCQGQTLATIKSTATTTLALDWPKNKLKTYILDADHRDDIKELAESIGSTYLTHSENLNDKASSINNALSQTDGQIVVLLDCDWKLDKNFLIMTLGWFVRDMKLGMLQTPQHFLAPEPSECSLQIVNSPDLTGHCALIRRSALVEAGGVQREPPTKWAHTALRLQGLGYDTAYIGFSRQEHTPHETQTVNAEPQTEFAAKIFRVDHPFGDKSLLWKQRLASLKAMLQFYYLVPRLIFLAAPLLYLWADVRFIQTSAALFAAYAVPYLMHDHTTRLRLQRGDRLTVTTDIRETALAWHILLLTTLTLMRTEFLSWFNVFRANQIEKSATLDRRLVISDLISFFFNMSVLVVGITHFLAGDFNTQEFAFLLFFLLWTGYNLMILAAKLAVAEEGREIQRHTRLQASLPAMIKLPSGRTVSCMTENFPEIALALKLPAPLAIENRLPVGISIFHANREFSFPAQVTLETDLVLRVNIDGPAQKVYRALGDAAFSRGEDWPGWFPDQDADRPIPLWISRVVLATRMMFVEFATHVGTFSRWWRFGSWMQIWKKKK